MQCDSIVSPPTESWSIFKSIARVFTRGDAHKSDIEEFKLCLRAFLSKLNFYSFPMYYLINSSVAIVGKLYAMSFALYGNCPRTRFSSFTSDEKLEVSEKLSIFVSIICLFQCQSIG